MVKRSRTPSSSSRRVRRRQMPTPPTTGVRIARAARDVAVNAAVDAVSRAYPAVGAGIKIARAGYRAAKGLNSLRKKWKSKGKQMKAAGFSGAAFSKSAGYFNELVQKDSLFDKLLVQGTVLKVECGHVLTDQRNVTYLAHSTMPCKRVIEVTLASIIKKLMKRAGFNLRDLENQPLGDYINSEQIHFTIVYKVKDGMQTQEQDFAYAANTTTVWQVSEAIRAWLESFLTTGTAGVAFPAQFLFMKMWSIVTFTTVTNRTAFAEIDLSDLDVTIYSKSYLKIQNRTVSVANNNEADDVDNVPIHGRYFEVKGNGTQFRQWNTPTNIDYPVFTTDDNHGILYNLNLPDPAGTNMFNDMPEASQFVGCYAKGKAHLDPGEIKTSVMYDEKTVKFTRLMHLVFNQDQVGPYVNRYRRVYLGKTRIFGFEKMITAVATTAENAFKVAFEHNFNLGVVVKENNSNQTAPRVITSTGAQG